LTAKSSRRILIAPLDWGLGHTTRCIPLIRYLQAGGHEVLVAGNELQRDFLQQACTGFEWLPLQGYEVRYAHSHRAFMPFLLAQVPRVLRRISAEHVWLQEQIDKYRIDGVISDNRYGLNSTKVPAVIITHQLQVLSGMGTLADGIVRRLHYRLLRPFSACWIADKATNGLSGKLAHPRTLPDIPCHYIGLLSDCAGYTQQNTDQDVYVLVLLSGTEPQRSILQDLLWEQCAASNVPVVFVAGSKQAIVPDRVPAHIRFIRQTSGADLRALIAGSSLVICRSGYSSVMDLAAMGKKAVLLPTPGQTEQEYLARYLQQQGLFATVSQKNFQLSEAIGEMTKQMNPPVTATDFTMFRPVVDQFIDAL